MRARAVITGLLALASAIPAAAQTRVYTLSGRYLSILDGATLQQIARLDLITRGNPSGIAIASNGSRAYVGLGGGISNITPGDPPNISPGPQAKVAVIDLLALTVLRTIDVGTQPTEVVASPSGDRVYVANTAAMTISVIRTSDDVVVGTVSLPGNVVPGSMVPSPDGSKLYSLVYLSPSEEIVDIDTATFAVDVFAASNPCASGAVVSPDGGRLYVSTSCFSAGSISVYDTTTGALLTSTTLARPVPRLAITPDGSKLVTTAGGDDNGVHGPTLVLDSATLAQLGSVTPSGQYVGIDAAGTHAFVFGGWGNTSPNFFGYQVTSINLQTYALEKNVTSTYFATGFAVAPVSPCGQFLTTPAYGGVASGGGSGSFTAPVPAGCPWSVTSTDPSWLTITSPASGIGPATISYTAAASTGPRTAEIHINGQVIPVYETQPLVMIDSPAQGTHVKPGFQIAGWVADLAAAGPASSTLNDALLVHVWAYPSDGSAPVFVGQSNAAGVRPDVAAVFPGYRSGGFNVPVTGVKQGTYTFVVFLFSPYVNSFAAVRTVTVTIDSSTFTVIDTLQPNASVTVPFELGGWAVDLSAATGSGVDAVNVYAYPDSGGAPTFIGTSGPRIRPDLVPYFGQQFLLSGFDIAVDGLAPGGYTMVAYAHSTVTGAFTPAVVHVTVTGVQEPLVIEALDVIAGSPNVHASGWAIDTRTPTVGSSGTGVLAVQAWAYPVNGGAPIFVGSAVLGFRRDDIAFLYRSSRYLFSGWQLVGTLPSGTFDVAFFALSAATVQFDNVRVRRITIP